MLTDISIGAAARFFLLAALLPMHAFATKDAAAYADLDVRRSRVDDYVARERLRNDFTSERVMARSQVKDFLDELEIEISYLEANSKSESSKGGEQLKESVNGLKRNILVMKRHPYCLSYNTSLLTNLNSILLLATGLGVIDVRTLTALARLGVKESDHVAGLAAIFEQELLYSAKTK